MNSYFTSRDGSRYRNRKYRGAAFFIFLIATAIPLVAQSSLVDRERPLGSTRRTGFQIYDLSAYSTWQSVASPQVGYFVPLSAGLKSDIGIGGGARMGWSHRGQRSNVSLVYGASYTGRIRYSEWNSLNHKLRLNASRHLTSKWTMGFSTAGVLSNYEQLMFEPTLYDNVAMFQGSFDDLASAVLTGTYSNDELASLLTGARLIESPSRTLLFGNRVFNASANASLSYAHSRRLSFTLSAGASRLQHLGDSKQEGPRFPYLIPSAHYANAFVGMRYSLTPRTEVGVEGSSGRSFSQFGQAYFTSVSGHIGRTMGRHWFAQIHAGGGFITPLHQTFQRRTGVRPVAGGTLGYKMYAQTFVGSYNRTVGDPYGVGAGDTSTVSAGWNWWRPGRSWGMNGGYGWQSLQSAAFQNVKGFRASLGLNKVIGQHTMLQATYVYGSYYGRYLTGVYDSTQHSVRLTVQWTPSPMGRY